MNSRKLFGLLLCALAVALTMPSRLIILPDGPSVPPPYPVFVADGPSVPPPYPVFVADGPSVPPPPPTPPQTGLAA